jgi:hypothetical protein
VKKELQLTDLKNKSSDFIFVVEKTRQKLSCVYSLAKRFPEWGECTSIFSENDPHLLEMLGKFSSYRWKNYSQSQSFSAVFKVRVISELNISSAQNAYGITPKSLEQCWEYFDGKYSTEILKYTFTEAPLDQIFCLYAWYGSTFYYWGVSLRETDMQVAVKALQRASEYLDISYGILLAKPYIDQKNDLHNSRTKAGKAGGIAKSETSRLIQSKLMKLIPELKPVEGWKSKEVAVDDLLIPLWEYIQTLNIPKQDLQRKFKSFNEDFDALRNTILKVWSLKNIDLKLAFEDAVTRKRTQKVVR